MAVFRVEKTRDYTVMANHHLKNRTLTLKAKGLMSLMLSLPENWDYTLKGLSVISVESIDAIREGIKELERAGYIIRSRRRNAKGQLKGTDYVIYEQPHLPDGKPILENPTLENPTQGKPALEKPTQENATQLNTNRSKTKSLNTHIENPNPSNPHQPYPAVHKVKAPGLDRIRDDEAEKYRKIVKENIEYDNLMHSCKANRDRLDEIVEIIVEALCSTKLTICISGDDYPASLVKGKLLKLNRMHIIYVFECLNKNTTYIRNIKKYLLTTLFNAPSTIDNYYSALVNHDMYGDGSRGK